MRKPKCKQNMEVFTQMLQERELILYGRSKEAVKICEKYKVKYIVDKDDELCDVMIGDVRIYSPDKLYTENPEDVVILVCASEKYSFEITEEIQRIEDFVILYWYVLDNKFLNDISCELYDCFERIHGLEARLYDDYSRKVLHEVVVRRIAGLSSSYGDLKVENEIQYIFPLALYSKTEGSILDCGGYIGDTIDRFVNKLGNGIDKIYSFEALTENVTKLESKKNEIEKRWNGSIAIVPYALADKEGTITFFETTKKGACFSPEFTSNTKFAYMNPVNTFQVKTVRIDDVIPKDEAVRYIKMDIEGAEYEALVGAENTIKREKPGLAISIYHNACDYYRIGELILSYVPEYKLVVRHHKSRHVDTVLYAWV